MLRYWRREDKPVMRAVAATYTAVVPANAGTHNPREWFGEDLSFGTTTVPNRKITRYGSLRSQGRQGD